MEQMEVVHVEMALVVLVAVAFMLQQIRSVEVVHSQLMEAMVMML